MSVPAAQVNVLPRDVVVTVYSTAGSATMTTTVKLWGYTIASGVWVPLGTGADLTKGTINAGAAIGETAGIADVIRHSEIVSGLFNFDRVYAENRVRVMMTTIAYSIQQILVEDWKF